MLNSVMEGRVVVVTALFSDAAGFSIGVDGKINNDNTTRIVR